VNLGATEGYEILTPLVTPVLLLLNDTNILFIEENVPTQETVMYICVRCYVLVSFSTILLIIFWKCSDHVTYLIVLEIIPVIVWLVMTML
jgi:hypothetical protein